MADKILLIDDDSDFTATMEMYLESSGYTLASAQNPIAGWREMERFNPDMILLDWEMPNITGIEMVKLIKGENAHRNRYVIMVTARGGTENVVQGFDAGADDYLVKPFQVEELLARVRSGLRIRSLEERIEEETKHMTVFEMAFAVADKIGNPIAAARLFQQVLMKNLNIGTHPDIQESVQSIGQLLDEAMELITKYQSIKKPTSIPAPGSQTMIAPE